MMQLAFEERSNFLVENGLDLSEPVPPRSVQQHEVATLEVLEMR